MRAKAKAQPAPQQLSFPVDYGFHNAHLQEASARLNKEQTYRDLSTIIICPTRSNNHGIPAKIVSAWMSLMRPMNQQVHGPMFITGREVGDAYESAIQMILNHPVFSKYKYMLTIEDDIIPQPDGLLRLYESIEGAIDGNKYDVVGGLYWTKGIGGQPMIYGDAADPIRNYRPQIPQPDAVQPCYGLGMGFNLFRLSLFSNPKYPKPYFRTAEDWDPHVGSAMFTQDLYFYHWAGQFGLKVACDTRVKCGHYDKTTDQVW